MKTGIEDTVAPTVGVRLSGTGGQGLVLAGKILAEAGAIHCGLNVVYTMSYGPEARGGASRSDVILSQGEVDDLVSDPVDILVCLSQKACDKYFPNLAYKGFMLVDSTNVSVVPTNRAVEMPLTELALEKCGGRMVTNVLALAVMCALTTLIPREALAGAVRSTVREDFLEQNLRTLELGYQLAGEYRAAAEGRETVELPDFRCLRGEVVPLRKPAGRNLSRRQ